MSDLIIEVKSILEGAEVTKLETLAPCKHATKKGVELFTYYDTSLVEGESILTMLKLHPNKLEIIRSKPYEQHMILGHKQKHRSDYHTQYGTLKLELVTTAWDYIVEAGVRRIHATYQVHINGEWQSRNNLEIIIRPA